MTSTLSRAATSGKRDPQLLAHSGACTGQTGSVNEIGFRHSSVLRVGRETVSVRV